MIVHQKAINSERIYIVDEVLNSEDVKEFHDIAVSLSYNKNESSYDSDKYSIFCTDLNPATFELSNVIGCATRRLVTELYSVESVKLILSRLYINLIKYGDMQFLHYDCIPNKNDITVVYFINDEWNYHWRGETIFALDKIALHAVLPKPGRFIIFPGKVQHSGGMPNRKAKFPRLSLVFKFQIK